MIDFIFPQRLHRLAYFIRGLTADGMACFLYSCNATMDSTVLWTSVIAVWIYGAFFIRLPRIRDVGMSGWWLVLMVIPIADFVIGIILLFRTPKMFSDRPDMALEPLALCAS
jgi:uncharacterized membrane protein YhaH (DUF805 family)